MTLPASGTITLGQINTELGRSSSATISLKDAETGVYGALNVNSPSRPSGVAPYAVSEWYCYNHQAFAPLLFTSSTTWTCPTGCTSILVECWGQGGAGGNASGVSGARGGGGGGGAYASSVLSVTPGVGYTVNVAPTRAVGSGGTITWFLSPSIVAAQPGANGSSATTNAQAASGTGGAAGSSIGSTTYSGGNGNTGYGGGGAGSTGAGNNATTTAAGGAKTENGGAGGARGTIGTAGAAGSVYGGGGGGGYANSATLRAGGSGAQGLIRITNLTVCTPPTTTSTTTTPPTTTTTTTAAGGILSVTNYEDSFGCAFTSVSKNGSYYIGAGGSGGTASGTINTGDTFQGSDGADCYGSITLYVYSTTRGYLFASSTSVTFGPGITSGTYTRLAGEDIYVTGNFFGYDPPPPCFVAGTMIKLADGTEAPIETLSEGVELESVLIDTLENTNDIYVLHQWSSNDLIETRTTSKISKFYPEEVSITIKVNNGLLQATYNHIQPARVNGIWRMIRMEHLRVGDILYDINGNLIDVISIEVVKEPTTVYKLTLSDTSHTYFANNILTHNIKALGGFA